MDDVTAKPSPSASKDSLPGRDDVVDAAKDEQEKTQDKDGGPKGGVEVTARPSPPLPEGSLQDKSQAADEEKRDHTAADPDQSAAKRKP